MARCGLLEPAATAEGPDVVSSKRETRGGFARVAIQTPVADSALATTTAIADHATYRHCGWRGVVSVAGPTALLAESLAIDSPMMKSAVDISPMRFLRSFSRQ